MSEDIRIGFFIEEAVTEKDDTNFKLRLYTSGWKLSLNLNRFLFYPAPKIHKVFELMYRSVDAPKGFGICKLALDYLLLLYDNETKEYKQEVKKIKACYKLIDTYLALYHLYTERR